MKTKTYQIINGEIKLIHGAYQLKKEFKYKVQLLINFFTYVCSLILTVYITWIIYKKCIIQFTLNETISLGAVFATLGSSLVAVFSLICSEQYSQFMDNIRILQTNLLEKENWERWPFVKRFWRNKVANGEYHYYILLNPRITFMDPNSKWQINFTIPFGKIDFRQMSVYPNLFKLIKFKNIYNEIIVKNNTIQDILIWNCLTDIYKKIIIYRWCQIVIWIGSCFVLGSIIFSFFYIQLIEIIELYNRSPLQ